MKVLITGAVLDPKWKGGEPLIANSLVEEFKKYNFEVVVYSRFRLLRDRIHDFFSLNDINPKIYRQYRSILKTHRPSIVLSFYDYDCSICLACRKEKVPLVVSINIWWPICPILSLYVDGRGPCKGPRVLSCIRHIAKISRKKAISPLISIFSYIKFLKRMDLLNSAKKIIVPSYYMKNKLSLFGLKNLSVIYYGIDVDKIKPIKWQNDSAKLIVTPTAYGGERKGFNHFLALAMKVKSDFNNVSFLAVGGYSGESLVKGLGWLSREELIDLLQKSYIVVIPVLWEEPFGIVALEAMAAGKPVVAYNSGGLSEIIVDGLTGFLVPRGNIDELASAVKYLLKNEEVAIKMGMEGRKRVEELFNLNRMVEQYAYELRRNIED